MTYVGNCLTWLIVKLVLLSVNTGGSGLWLCMLLSVALIACSNNWTALRAVYKKKYLFFTWKWSSFKMNYVVVDTSHNEHLLPFTSDPSNAPLMERGLHPDLICLPQSARVRSSACLSVGPRWVQQHIVVQDECNPIRDLQQSERSKWRFEGMQSLP